MPLLVLNRGLMGPCFFGRLAQLVEHRPYKAVAAGSSPAAPTIYYLER